MSSTSPAVGRALDLLLYLAGKPGPVSGAAIARDLRMPRSSTYHLLDVLMARGFIVHFPDQRTYGLGMAAFEIGSAYLRHDPLEMLARPVLGRLVAQVGETAHLGVLHGAETLYLLKEQPPGVPHPGHPGHRCRGAPAGAPDRQRPLDPGSPAGRSGACAFPGSARLRRPNRPRTGHTARVASGAGGRTAAEIGPEIGLITEGLQSVAACAFDHSGRPAAAISVTWRQGHARATKAELVRAVRAGAAAAWALSGRAPDGWFGPSDIRDGIAVSAGHSGAG